MTKKEQSEALDKLRATFHPGDTVYTVLRHVSRSGMSRSISVLDHDNHDVSFWVSRALGWPVDQKNYGVKVSGCGMDMGFHLVYSLSHVLFPDGFGCVGENREARTRCPSNDHSNGDRDYTPYCHRDIPSPDQIKGGTGTPKGNYSSTHWHRDGGYALSQRWI